MTPARDITDRFEDVNPYDRIYQSDHGYTVKVRLEDVTKGIYPVFLCTGSWADDATGKARRTGVEEPFIVPPQKHVIQGETSVDLEALKEEFRQAMVRSVDLIVANYQARVASDVKNAPPPVIQ